jgi:hypothetical protein
MDGEDQGILPPAGDHIAPRCQREHGLLHDRAMLFQPPVRPAEGPVEGATPPVAFKAS